ncbi:preprotein translocase subunit YajC [Ruaniaceae bacterium KH17]|nr:preprotein translocase subunit YajC [Ruaniaceae bacterium KH17]
MEIILLGGVLLLFIAMNYFGKKKQREAETKRSESLVLGNNVRTHSGFYGKIVDIDGLTVTLESPSGGESVWHKNAIHGAEEPPFQPEYDEDEDAELSEIEGFSSEAPEPETTVSTLDNPIENEQDK